MPKESKHPHTGYDFWTPELLLSCKESYQTVAYHPQYAHCASKKEMIYSICFLLVPTLQIVGGSSQFFKLFGFLENLLA